MDFCHTFDNEISIDGGGSDDLHAAGGENEADCIRNLEWITKHMEKVML